MARLCPDVPRHVHGDPRHPGGRDIAAGDPARAGDFTRCHQLDSDGVSDRGNRRDPVDRMADARADLAVAVRGRGRPFHGCLDRLRVERQLCDAGRLPRAAGLCRGNADPGGVFRGVPAVSASPASDRHHDGWHHGGAGAHHRARGRRLDHRDLFVALAVPDQRDPRHHRRVRHALAAAARKTQFSRVRRAGPHFARADGRGPGEP